MPYVGNPLADAYSARVKQDLTGGSGTSFTLSHAVSSPNDLSIYINHVRQEPTTAYTVNGTALTMTGSVAGTDDFYIIYDELAVQSISHPSNQALTATAGTFTSGLVGTTGTFSGALSATTGTFSGAVDIQGQELILDADNDTSITADTDDQIDFKVGGSDKMSLTATALNVTGNVEPTGSVRIDDGQYLQCGNSYDLQIYHNGSHSYIQDQGTGDLYLLASSFRWGNADNSEHFGGASTNGAVWWKYDNTTVFTTTANDGIKIGSGNAGRISFGQRTNTGNAYIGKLNDDCSVVGNSCLINFGSTSGEDFLDFHTHHSGLVGGKMATLWGDGTWVHSYFQNTTKGGTNAYSMYPAGSGNAPLSYYNKTLTTNSYSHIWAVNSSNVGNIAYTSSGVSYNSTSDYRLKENVSYDWDATSRLKQLKPARFNFKTDKDKTVDGFLAHEVSSIVPEAITGIKDGVEEKDIENQNIKKGDPIYQQIDQSKLVPLLVKVIQELEARVTELESK